ncbi:MAG TPA: hypothetical protein VI386_18430 [Candidatus Sulfotelmatobacter sp.]
MSRRWKPPKGDRVDLESVRRDEEFKRELGHVLEYGTEDDFVDVLKSYKPNMGKEELKNSIMQFRVFVREKRGL